MKHHTHFAFDALLNSLGESLVFGEVSVQSGTFGFELRHASDAQRPPEQLVCVAPDALREIAQTTTHGAFRPNKAAANLRRGWRTVAPDRAEAALALDALYPGAVADWLAARQNPPPVTSYREFTGRQTGMYAGTQRLTDPQAEGTVRACCAVRFCLKHRLWTVGSLPAEIAGQKSVIPCLEPCALLLEFARRVARLETEDRLLNRLAPGEVDSLDAALEIALAHPNPAVREGDSSHPANPRRLQWLRDRLAVSRNIEISSKEV